jgi:hypothetical protein
MNKLSKSEENILWDFVVKHVISNTFTNNNSNVCCIGDVIT